MTHKLVNAFPWASHAAVAGMTVAQIMNVVNAKAGAEPAKAATFEEYAAALDRAKAAELEWDA